MPDVISWEVASRVAKSVAGYFPEPPKSEIESLELDLISVFSQAQLQVANATGLNVAGSATPLVMTRSEWAEANILSFRTTLTPLLEQMSEKLPRWRMSSVSSAVAGVQLGAILGWFSSKVLGQFDVILADASGDFDDDKVYFVAPNIIGVEMKYGFDQKQFRHWIALHELTHRAQFNGVEWMRGYFKALLDDAISFANPDPSAFFAALKKVFDEIREGRNPLGELGPIGFFATPEQMGSLNKITGLMSLLEGHGDVVMNRAGANDILESVRFEEVFSQRRNSQRGLAKLVSQLFGIDAKMRQYQDGAKFVHRVEEVGGAGLFNRVWEHSENLPDISEIRDPALWITRLGARS
ncbi:MAG: hypothetical protein HKL84_07625 [Acidimicrobiaceae bacterium]|nr:hypothetical protein [Acidimicrobiaceae bacterium]